MWKKCNSEYENNSIKLMIKKKQKENSVFSQKKGRKSDENQRKIVEFC